MDHYEWYRDALAGKRPAIHDGQPQCGYFKRRNGKDGPWIAAAIWKSGESTQCRVGKTMADATTEWTWLAKNPITEAEARHFFTEGRWPSEDAPIAGIGDNRPSDPFEALKFDIEAELEAARDLAKGGVFSKEQADRFGNRIGALRDLGTKAEKTRTEEKEPHLNAGRAVDAKYGPMVKKVDAALKHLRKMVGDWMAAEEAKQRAAQQEAEKARREAEAARLKAEQDAAAANLPPPVEAELPPLPEVHAVKVQAGGVTGRAVSLRTVKRCVVTDHKKALKKFADHEEVVALVAKLAERALKAGTVVPGAELVEERVAA